MLERRASIGVARAGKERHACEILFSSSIWREAFDIAIYISIKNEFSTAPLVERAWRDGKRVSVPKILNFKAREMVFWPIKSWSDLRPGRMGIMEPTHDEALQFSESSLMLLPGLAFDNNGWRLGYGGGFYDCFLAQLSVKPRLLGLCFSEQIIEAVPHDQFDMPVEGICSDAGLEWVSHDTF